MEYSIFLTVYDENINIFFVVIHLQGAHESNPQTSNSVIS